MNNFMEVKGKTDIEYVAEDMKYTNEGGMYLSREIVSLVMRCVLFYIYY